MRLKNSVVFVKKSLSQLFLCGKFCTLILFFYLCIAFEQGIELWCNGNTADFGSVVLGSSPGSSTQQETSSGVFCRLLMVGISLRQGALHQ